MSGAPRNPYLIRSIEASRSMLYPINMDEPPLHTHDTRTRLGLEAVNAVHQRQHGAKLQPDSNALIRALRDGERR